jgi:hypothetical protein
MAITVQCVYSVVTSCAGDPAGVKSCRCLVVKSATTVLVTR